MKVRSWTRRLRKIRAVGGPGSWALWKDGGEAGGWGGGRTLGVFNYKFVVV